MPVVQVFCYTRGGRCLRRSKQLRSSEIAELNIITKVVEKYSYICVVVVVVVVIGVIVVVVVLLLLLDDDDVPL